MADVKWIILYVLISEKSSLWTYNAYVVCPACTLHVFQDRGLHSITLPVNGSAADMTSSHFSLMSYVGNFVILVNSFILIFMYLFFSISSGGLNFFILILFNTIKASTHYQ